MARGDQLSRQWKIIQALSASKEGLPASRLALQVNCHPRTVYRDLEALQQAGFPLYTDRKDGKTRWSLIEGARQQLPIPLTLTELMALHFSRNLLKALQGTAMHDSLASLFEKVKATLPEQYLSYLEEVQRTLSAGVKARKSYGRFEHVLDTLRQAATDRHVLEINYFTMSRRSLTRRRVRPYQIWYYDETFYLIAYCELRREERLFAVDRIRAVSVLEERFDIPAGFDVEKYMHKSFGVFQGESQTVRILFSSEAAGYIGEKVWHPSQRLETRPDGSLLFSAEVAGIDEIAHWILQWGSAATVVEPVALRNAVVEQARQILQNHQTPQSDGRPTRSPAQPTGP